MVLRRNGCRNGNSNVKRLNLKPNNFYHHSIIPQANDSLGTLGPKSLFSQFTVVYGVSTLVGDVILIVESDPSFPFRI